MALFSLSLVAARKGFQYKAPELPLVEVENNTSHLKMGFLHRGGEVIDYVRFERVSQYLRKNQLDVLISSYPNQDEFNKKWRDYLFQETLFKARIHNPNVKDFPIVELDVELYSSTVERQVVQLAASHHHQTYRVPVTSISFHGPGERNDLEIAKAINSMLYTDKTGIFNELYETENPHVVNLDRVRNKWNLRRNVALFLGDPEKMSVGDWGWVSIEHAYRDTKRYMKSIAGFGDDFSPENIWASRIAHMTLGSAITDFRYETLTPILDLMPDHVKNSTKFKEQVFFHLEDYKPGFPIPPIRIGKKDDDFLKQMTGMTYEQGIKQLEKQN